MVLPESNNKIKLMISSEVVMTSLVEVSVEASAVCLAAYLVEALSETLAILVVVASPNNLPVFLQWVAQALHQPRLKLL